jgi:hypothetical protein
MASNPIKMYTKKGDTFLKTITITYKATGLPIDLTDATIVGTIKKNIEDTDVFDNFSIHNRDDANGQFDLVLSPTQTESFSVDGHSDSYYFEVSVAFDGSPTYIKTYMYGNLIIGQ